MTVNQWARLYEHAKIFRYFFKLFFNNNENLQMIKYLLYYT